MPESNVIRFLSWNLNMMNTSAAAPAGWRIDETEALIRERVLDHEIDVVCFQELPAMVPYIETHDLAPANTISHSGTIATVIHKNIFEGMVCRAIGRFAVVCVFPKLSLSIANVHLEAGRGAEEKRFKQLKTLSDVCPTKGLLIVGDTNTRVAEESKLAEIGLLGKRPPSPTWDSRRNPYSTERSNKFSAYFTRYFHNAAVEVSNVHVFNQPVKLKGESFFLSDHFALSGTAKIATA